MVDHVARERPQWDFVSVLWKCSGTAGSATCRVPGDWPGNTPSYQLWFLWQGSLLQPNADSCQGHPLQWQVRRCHLPAQNPSVVSFWVWIMLAMSACLQSSPLFSLRWLATFHPEKEPFTPSLLTLKVKLVPEHICVSFLDRKWPKWDRPSQKKGGRNILTHVTVNTSNDIGR